MCHQIAHEGGARMTELTVQETPIDDSPFPSRPPGTGRRSWRQKPVRHERVPASAYESGVETDDPIMADLEHGTGLQGPRHARYRIRPRRPGGVLRFFDRKTGRWVYAREVMHPGIRGQHMVATAAAITQHEYGLIARGPLERWARRQERGNRLHVVVRGPDYGDVRHVLSRI